jgi:hypothetical protein
MRQLTIIAAALLLCSCAAQKAAQETQRDSVHVETIERTVYKDSIIFVPLPAENDAASLPDSDTSRLETSLAESEAFVKDGQLHHSLRNKETLLPVPVKLPSVIRQEYAYALRDRKVVEVVEVERELSWWQRTLLILGGGLLAAVAVWILLKLGKLFNIL